MKYNINFILRVEFLNSIIYVTKNMSYHFNILYKEHSNILKNIIKLGRKYYNTGKHLYYVIRFNMFIEPLISVE